ncbi:MAG: hypothetical protein MZV70_75650 [Desulfobacterales bacterium]|nr:hypothetical protein [Desulfobacterales bacterium]
MNGCAGKWTIFYKIFTGPSAGRRECRRPSIGRYALAKLQGEEKRLKEGWSYEPRTLREKNAAALALENKAPGPFRIAIPEVTLSIPRPASMRSAR